MAKRGRPTKTVDTDNADTLLNMIDFDSSESMPTTDLDQKDQVEYKMIDPEWTDYVLAQMEPTEIDKKGYPTVDGTRRMVEKLLGRIISSHSNVVQCPTPENNFRGTVVHDLKIRTFDNDVIEVNGAVDIQKNEVQKPFDQYLISCLCTRAEGKALRRALQLKTIVAEEQNDAEVTSGGSGFEKISDTQISLLEVLARKNNVNIVKFIKGNYNVDSIETVSREQGTDLCRKMSEMQRTESIPEDLVGYSPNWKNEFKTQE